MTKTRTPVINLHTPGPFDLSLSSTCRIALLLLRNILHCGSAILCPRTPTLLGPYIFLSIILLTACPKYIASSATRPLTTLTCPFLQLLEDE